MIVLSLSAKRHVERCYAGIDGVRSGDKSGDEQDQEKYILESGEIVTEVGCAA
jgi:hypothetical protein